MLITRIINLLIGKQELTNKIKTSKDMGYFFGQEIGLKPIFSSRRKIDEDKRFILPSDNNWSSQGKTSVKCLFGFHNWKVNSNGFKNWEECTNCGDTRMLG